MYNNTDNIISELRKLEKIRWPTVFIWKEVSALNGGFAGVEGLKANILPNCSDPWWKIKDKQNKQQNRPRWWWCTHFHHRIMWKVSVSINFPPLTSTNPRFCTRLIVLFVVSLAPVRVRPKTSWVPFWVSWNGPSPSVSPNKF